MASAARRGMSSGNFHNLNVNHWFKCASAHDATFAKFLATPFDLPIPLPEAEQLLRGTEKRNGLFEGFLADAAAWHVTRSFPSGVPRNTEDYALLKMHVSISASQHRASQLDEPRGKRLSKRARALFAKPGKQTILASALQEQTTRKTVSLPCIFRALDDQENTL